MQSDDERPGRRTPRVPWYQNSNWLLLVVVIVVGVWLARIFSQNMFADGPKSVEPVAGAPRAVATVARVYRKPLAPATIVQHAHAVADRGVADPKDLTGAFSLAPKAGDLLLAFASTGFGCIVASGWTALGGESGSVVIAYRIAQAGDGKVLVPFTTSRSSTYSLELIEIAGGPDIVASPQVGGTYVLASTIPTTISLAIPQTGGILFRFYAASGTASETGPPVAFTSTLPKGQAQSLVDHVTGRGWGADLTVQATTTDPKSAVQPFIATEATTFPGSKAPGNTVSGWFVWVGGPLGAHR